MREYLWGPVTPPPPWLRPWGRVRAPGVRLVPAPWSGPSGGGSERGGRQTPRVSAYFSGSYRTQQPLCGGRLRRRTDSGTPPSADTGLSGV